MGVIIRQGFKAAISNYIGMVLGFVSMFVLFPLYYPTKELGAIRIFIELATVLSAFALMGTHYSVNRFFPFFKTNDQTHHGFFLGINLSFDRLYFVANFSCFVWSEFLYFYQPRSQSIRRTFPFAAPVDFYYPLPKCHRSFMR